MLRPKLSSPSLKAAAAWSGSGDEMREKLVFQALTAQTRSFGPNKPCLLLEVEHKINLLNVEMATKGPL